VESTTRGDPESPLKWTSKSTRNIVKELRKQGTTVCPTTVSDILKICGYSLQSNRKTREVANHPARNAQFEYIAKKVTSFQKRKQPVISVDSKKKELVGNYKNKGREYTKKGIPVEVLTHDFPDKEKGKAAPFGVYDLTHNCGWVSVGISHDTAEFAVETIRRWWNEMGKPLFPKSHELLITADCGGSNSYRTRLWKIKLQELADETGLKIHVCHFPPGTSKWNKIEHRMFSFITKNVRGRPLLDRATIVNCIGNTTTSKGLKIKSYLDEGSYQKGVKVSDKEFATIQIERAEFHGEWNYIIRPRRL